MTSSPDRRSGLARRLRDARSALWRSTPRRLAVVLAVVVVVDLVAAGAVYVDRRDDPLVPDFARVPSATVDWDVDTYRHASPLLHISTDLPASARLVDGHVQMVRGPDDPDLLLRFALGALDRAQDTGDARWQRLAVNATDDVLDTVVDGRVPHDFAVTDSRGRRIDKGWVAGQTQGLLLSTLARLYEVTGDERWRDEAHPVFSSLAAFRGFFAGSAPAPAHWTTSVDGAGYLWFDRFSEGLESSYVLSEQLWTGLGVYDYRRVLARTRPDRQASARLFTGSLATLHRYLPRYRVPDRIWIDSLVAGNRSVGAHFLAEAQLDLVARITDEPRIERYDRLVRDDRKVPYWVVKPIDVPRGRDPYATLPPDLALAASADAPARVTPDGDTARDGAGMVDPTRSAGFAVAALQRYQETGREVWLTRAEEAVDEALSTSRDGLLQYRYRQDNVFGEQMNRPWASARGQGLMLSALSRLYEIDRDPRRLAQAQQVFDALAQVRDYGYPRPDPWLASVDYSGYLWFEQYADGQGASLVVSGHLAAVIGLYDYWNVSGDRTAEAYLRGGLSTIRDALPLVRHPGRYASSSLAKDLSDPRSHRVIEAQIAALARVTGDPELTRYATRLARDYEKAHRREER